MVWTPPKQFQSGEILTAADLNTYLRDNLLENEVTKCTTAGAHLTTDAGGNLIERKLVTDTIETSESLTGLPYVYLGSSTWADSYLTPRDLGTAGPTVTVETGSKVIAIASVSCSGTYGALQAQIDVCVSVDDNAHKVGSFSTVDPLANQTFFIWPMAGSKASRSKLIVISGLTPGINTFTMKYNTGQNSGAVPANKLETNTYSNRQLVILAL